MKRRTLLRAGLLTAGVGIAGAGWPAAQMALGSAEPGRLLRSQVALPPHYQARLPIPAQLAPTASDATSDYYTITQRPAGLAILPGLTTPAWTYGGTFPGPTIVSRSGRRTVVRHHNALPVPIAVHLHGGHTPPDSDGYPLDLIEPQQPTTGTGEMASGMSRNSVVGQREYVYPMQQRAATLWYHDHRMSYTGQAVWRGLAGFHIIHDEEERGVPLPQGHRDIPLMITDRSFAADGSFHYPLTEGGEVAAPYMNGVLGDVVLVNGAPWPVLETDPARYRFRILNASNARRYRLRLDPPPPDGPAFTQIGSDGGLLSGPLSHDAIDIAPAERFDIIVDFSRYRRGTRVQLINTLGAQSTTRVMRFDVLGTDRSDESTIPDRLSDGVAPLDRGRAATTRTFLFGQGRAGMWTINNKPYEPGVPVAAPRIDDVEIWRFITDLRHPVHVHLNHFQVLSRNNRPPGRFDHGWKDTIDVAPTEAVEVIVRFTDYRGIYLVHCHNLEHEDMAMMADFVTV
ncbi:multicopper oxidase family protein [Mycobacterium sp. 852002-10029_SCH5224772]|uniref:multicopper oxidase family protein n=1 Tax=Mycobacterium sp. 852002-10029_SCH5224772 TaxID=1834083 RepID=UPI0007FC315C|nr:multicopper oxidase family protein [Mycobacterium sp. 852002-10029_SCH5224772]OBF10389.1 copper oxidase [Mycobacterium sp. 852002-10029_SCH5224772]